MGHRKNRSTKLLIIGAKNGFIKRIGNHEMIRFAGKKRTSPGVIRYPLGRSYHGEASEFPPLEHPPLELKDSLHDPGVSSSLELRASRAPDRKLLAISWVMAATGYRIEIVKCPEERLIAQIMEGMPIPELRTPMQMDYISPIDKWMLGTQQCGSWRCERIPTRGSPASKVPYALCTDVLLNQLPRS
jgi:hypothetical protein